jgi:hypothetical protein
MKKITISLLMAALVLAGSLAGCGSGEKASPAGLTFQKSYVAPVDGTRPEAEGTLYLAGKVPVLHLAGTFRQMGMEYGDLLADQLNRMYDEMSADFGKLPGVSYEGMLQIGKWMYDGSPRDLQDLIAGAAETSGLGLEKQMMLNAVEFYTPATAYASGCSGCAAWGPYTSGQPLVFGRNYDYAPKFADTMVVTVYEPAGSDFDFACAAYAGIFNATTALNSEGLFLEVNNGEFSGGETEDPTREFGCSSTFSMIDQRTSLSALDYAFESTNTDMAFIVNAACGNDAASYEWPNFGVKRRGPDADGLLVATNNFVDPAWEGVAGIQPVGEGPRYGYTLERRANLLALAEKNKGSVTPEVMMEMMATPLDQGGPLLGGSRFVTCYQVVTVPSTFEMWVRVPGFQEWAPVDLAALFQD